MTVNKVAEVSAQYLTELDANAVPAGYKQTELGVIPEDWGVKQIKEFALIITGPFGTLLKASEYSASDGVPLISVGEVKRGYFSVSDDTPRVCEKTKRRLPQYILKFGDIVFGRKGGVDRSALIREAQVGWFLGSDGIAIRPVKAENGEYLSQQLQSARVISWLLANSAGTTMSSLNQEILGRVALAFPRSEKEQTAIANALSDVDALISELEKLIAKKQAIKTATMQQLLTGRTRLPQFALREDGSKKGYKQSELGEIPEDWEVGMLGENSRTYSGGTPSTSNKGFYGGDIRWITSSDLNKAFIDDVQGRITDEGLGNSSAKMVAANTFLVALYGATAGVCAITLVDAAINQAVLAVVPDRHLPMYLYYWFSKSKESIIDTYTQGGQPNLSGDIIRSIKVPMPSLDEQAAIADIISDMDSEIQALQQRLTKTRQIKQGMMQELLTGKTRLIQPAGSTN